MQRARTGSTSTKADSTGPARWLKRDKAEAVWSSFKSIFGIRWVDQFGSEPSSEWREVLNLLEQRRLDYAINHIRDSPPPYPGWLPSLNEFQTIAHRFKLNVHDDSKPRVKPHWVEGTCAAAAVRFSATYDVPTRLWDTMKAVYAQLMADYRSIADGDATLTKAEVTEAVEAKLLKWWRTFEEPVSKHATPEASSSSMRTGPLIQAALSISVSSSDPAKTASTPSSSTNGNGTDA